VSGLEGTAALLPEPIDDGRASEADARRLRLQHTQEFEAFVENSYHVVERIIRAACWDREMAEDALHEAYLHARVQWPKIRDYGHPIGWVITTARNKIRNEHQRRLREAAVAPEDLPPTPRHADIADTWEAQDALRAWLHQLPPRQAEVFQMTREGFSNQEVALILGLAETSVRFYKAAAKRRLRESAEAAGFSDSASRRSRGGGHESR